MFGRKKFPIPKIVPAKCPECGKKLRWTAVTVYDPVIRIFKPDHYQGDCPNGHVVLRDGRGQPVEPAVENLAPDRSDFANSPQGPQPYSGYTEFVKQERDKAAALKAKQAAAAAPNPPAEGEPATGEPAPAGAPASTAEGAESPGA